MKKKLLIAVIGCALILSACGNKTVSQQEESVQTETADETAGTNEDSSEAAENAVSADAAEDSISADAAGDAENTADSSEQAEEKDAQNLSAVYEEISSSVELVSPMLLTDDMMQNYYSINPADVDEYVFEMSEDATSAEMVVLMKISDADKMAEVKTQLETELSYKLRELEDYLPEEYEMVSKAQVKTDGDYLWLVASRSADRILEIVEKYL